MSDGRPPVVRNAGNAREVRSAERLEKRRRERLLAVTKQVMSTAEGREFLRRQLEGLGIFHSIMATSAMIYYNAGRQDAGHELLALLVAADGDAYLLMEIEAREREKAEDREVEATHTKTVDQTIPDED